MARLKVFGQLLTLTLSLAQTLLAIGTVLYTRSEMGFGLVLLDSNTNANSKTNGRCGLRGVRHLRP